MRLFLPVVLSLLLSLGAVAEPKRHTEFFDRGYAGDVMNPNDKVRRNGSSPVRAPSLQPTPQRTPGNDAPAFTGPVGDATAEPSPSPSIDSEAEKDKMEAIPVKSVGAILNATPPEELYGAIQKLVGLSMKFNYPVGEVTVIGPLPKSKNDVELLGLTVRGGLLTAVDAVPERYKITSSPTWILETDNGEILLEGFPSPDRFLNSKGQFVPNIGGR